MSMPVRETTGEQGWVLEMPGKLKRWKTVKKNQGILGIESGTWQCRPDHQKERG